MKSRAYSANWGGEPAKGNRWTQSRVAYVRKKHGIDPPDENTRDTSILNLAQAMKHSGVSDTTLMRLINEKVLPAKQIAPYAPLEIQRADLDREPVSSILKHLKATGKLILDGNPSANQPMSPNNGWTSCS